MWGRSKPSQLTCSSGQRRSWKRVRELFTNLDAPPGAPQLHRWADWAELIALTSIDSGISLAEFAEVTERAADALMTDGTGDQDREEDEKESLVGAIGNAARFRDEARERSVDIFEYLADRSLRFGESYPFEVDAAAKTIERRDLTDRRVAYLFLLSCASLRYVGSKAAQVNFGARFELLAEASFASMLPIGATVGLFGANSLRPAMYSGDLKSRIERLAADLGEVSLAVDEDFETRDHGDGGLDLVGWLAPKDGLGGRVVLFGQAAATPNWITKQHSSSADTWGRTIPMVARPTNVVFIPFDFRRPGGRWYAKRHIHNSVVMDRERILKSLYAGDEWVPTSSWANAIGVVNPDELRTMVAQSAEEL